ncbi:MAG: hypothetical protein QOH92_1193 [Chloroflexota bacterium]|nr:hypothetical protein [Chloroflexota bacterium]
MSRAVCRTCWTWYANGESVCPKCRTRLVGAADSGGSASAADDNPRGLSTPGPRADAPFPTPARSGSSGISWPLWLLIGGGALAVIAVIGLLVLGLALTGALGPVTSSDGAFSVRVPKGWAQGSTVTTTVAKPVLALARLKTTNGVKPEFVVADLGQSVPLATIEAGWDPVLRSGRVTVPGTLGGLTRTTVAGAPALTAEFQGSKYTGQLLFVDYGSKTYIVEMASDPSEFVSLRASDFSAILSSWHWQ